MKSPVISAKGAAKRLAGVARPDKIAIYQNFFKTGKGQYDEGDIFIGVSVPDTRKIAKEFKALSLSEIKKLIHSKIHEERLLGLILIVNQFQAGDEKLKAQLYRYYLKNKKYINNWDLVDVSAHLVVGIWLLDKDRSVLYRLAKSKSLWDRRIAILSTFSFIRKNDFKDTIKLSECFLDDEHDLMHKAVGWMLREVGKRDEATLFKFLKQHLQKMPRTMLRYAIEKFPEKKRKAFLKR